LVEAIPLNLRYAISVGIGLFIAYIGLKSSGIIVSNDATITSLGEWNATSLIAAAGIFLGGVLMTLKVHGALFFTIIIMTVVGIPFGVTVLPEDFSIISSPQSMSSIAFKLDFSRFITLDLNYYIVVFTLLFMDLFNTLGTLIATASFAGMVDNTGKIHGLNKALMADAVGTAAGALCGTSTVTTYVESATGVMEGGRTGMTSLTVSILFLVALFFSPLFLIIPPAATTSALVIVGVLMARNVTNINFSDLTEAVPAFITFLTMPLTYSISDGIVLGMLSYVIIKIGCGRYKEPSVAIYIISAFFILNFILN
jgi:AGZA family xanthine/uracil permease-like MFS transporter